jgi:hypothetical protein
MPHPELPKSVDAVEAYGGNWPDDRRFPLTPDECKAVLMGYAVLPSSAPMTVDDLLLLPGKFELFDGRVVLWRA